MRGGSAGSAARRAGATSVLAAASMPVATTDTLVHGPDFRLAWSSAFDLGWKAAAVNLADVAAMGGRPTALLVALGAPAQTPVALVRQIAARHGGSVACDNREGGGARFTLRLPKSPEIGL